MKFRTIMIFPQFPDMEIIDIIRRRYDPLADLVKPHITLVFPFESEITNEELKEILYRRLARIKPFEIELSGITKQQNKFGNYLFLNVKKGKDKIINIHKILYGNEFKDYHLGVDYIPHMTIGNLPDIQALSMAYEKIKHIDFNFRTIIDRIYVEIIGDKEESIIVIEQELFG